MFFAFLGLNLKEQPLNRGDYYRSPLEDSGLAMGRGPPSSSVQFDQALTLDVRDRHSGNADEMVTTHGLGREARPGHG